MAAVDIPGGEDELLEQGLLGWGVGVEFVLVGGFEGVEGGEFVGGADDGVGGGETVFFGVLGDGGFAVRRAGAGGGLGVELVGLDLCGGGHVGSLVDLEERGVLLSGFEGSAWGFWGACLGGAMLLMGLGLIFI